MNDVAGLEVDDLQSAAHYADPNGSNSGASYLIFGRDFNGQVTNQGTSAGETITGTAGTDRIVAGQGNDTIQTISTGDVVLGGQGNDVFRISGLTFQRINGGTGSDRVILDASNTTWDLRTLANDRLTSIEEFQFLGSKSTLVLSNLEISNLTQSLVVSGPANGLNRVELNGGWTPGSNTQIGGRLYRTFTFGATSILIENTVQVSGPKVVITVGTPIVGDWNGDGRSDLGFFKDGVWYLDLDGSRSFEVNEYNTNDNDLVIVFGQAGDRPVVGNWDGAPGDDLGVYRGAGDWILDSNGSRTMDGADTQLNFGVGADQPVVGDWNGDGIDEVGTFRGPNWYLEVNGIPGWQGNDFTLVNFGSPSDTPVVAAWGNRNVRVAIPNFVGTHPVSRVGVQRGKTWYLDTDSRLGHGGTDTTIVNFGEGFPIDRSLGGDWDGNGVGEPGVFRFATGAWYLETDGSRNYGASDKNILDLVFVNPVAPASAGPSGGPLPSGTQMPASRSSTQKSASFDLALNRWAYEEASSKTEAFEPLRPLGADMERIAVADKAIEIDLAVEVLLW